MLSVSWADVLRPAMLVGGTSIMGRVVVNRAGQYNRYLFPCRCGGAVCVAGGGGVERRVGGLGFGLWRTVGS